MRPLRSWYFDILVAGVVTTIAVSGSVDEAHPSAKVANAHQLAQLHASQPGAAYALVVIAGIALVWRRVFPLPVLGVTVAATGLYAALGFVPGAALTTVYVALFTVSCLETRRTAIAAGLVAIGVGFLAAGGFGVFGWLGGTNTVMVACSVAAMATGVAVAGHRQALADLRVRAERAERDREAEARSRVDAERLRIARELHDVVAHSMSMINVQAGVAAHVMNERPEEAAEALTAIKSASREGLRELRAILRVLRQVDNVDGREPAPRLSQLDALADATTQAGLPTAVAMSGAAPARLPEAVELAAYRIVQESLTNVLRHAGPAAHATVAVAFEPGTVIVQVDDDGHGSSTDADSAGPGSGLVGIRERAAAFGGTVEAGPRPDGGWRVRAVLPVASGGAP